jgi:hypothetical protein
MKKLLLYLTLTLFVFVGFKFASASEVTGNLNPGLDTGIAGVTRAAPTLSPVAGTYTSAQTVSLAADGSTKICYTTNGTTPACATATTCTTGTALANSGTVSVPSSMTIKSAACYADDSTGPVATSAYTINIPSGGGGGGGGGGSSIAYCSSVTYSAWGSCVGSLQSRSVLSSTPSGCTLTTSQQLAAQQSCTVNTSDDPVITPPGTTPVITPVITPGSPVNVAAVMATERALVTKTNAALTNRLAGRILLQVEEKGEAWYVEPVSKQKHFMGRPADAFDMMRRFGVGISEANFSKFEKSGVPARFAGRIFLRVEKKGEAYYVNPVDMKLNYLGRPADAFNLMRELALGISNANIRQIPVGEIK